MICPSGGYPFPALNLASEADRAAWFEAYLRTYLERDLRQLAAIENLTGFQRLVRATALRLGGLSNQANLARDAGIPSTTAQRYLDLLEVSYQLLRIESYAVNRDKRLVKQPRLYWSDPGLALHLAGGIEPTGAHLENLIAGDLFAWRESRTHRPNILFWRTSKGAEVDFVIETPRTDSGGGEEPPAAPRSGCPPPGYLHARLWRRGSRGGHHPRRPRHVLAHGARTGGPVEPGNLSGQSD